MRSGVNPISAPPSGAGGAPGESGTERPRILVRIVSPIYVMVKRNDLQEALKKIRKAPKNFKVLIAMQPRLEDYRIYLKLHSEIITYGSIPGAINLWFSPDPFVSYDDLKDAIVENIEYWLERQGLEFGIDYSELNLEVIE